MHPSPTYKRKRSALARHLKHLRENSGLSGNQFAKAIGWAQSKVSRIETGAQLPSEEDVRVWLQAFSASKGELGSALVLLEQAEAEYASWRTSLKVAGGSQNKQKQVKELEASVSCLREFQLSLIPGLLQTYDYAHSVLYSEFGPQRFGSDKDDIAGTLSIRMQRQSILYEGTRSFNFVIPEACLRTRISGVDVQSSQLQRLIDLNSLPNVEIEVITFETPLPVIPLSNFIVYDSDLVVIETLAGEQQLSGEEDIMVFLAAFAACRAVTKKGEEADSAIRACQSQLQ